MDSVFNRVKWFFQKQGLDHIYWVAYSGGLDSHVLLHICSELRKTLPLHLRAVYVNHHLSANANAWASHCATICHDLQLDFVQKNVSVSCANDQSPEEAARLARYQAFAELMAPCDFLLTAHQQDDQAETVLLQLLRGAGPKGLAAMPAVKPFATGFHARPLLDFARADLKHYAEQQQLKWIEDESNFNIGYTRNFLRHEILPILKMRWPSVTKTLSRVAENCAEAQELLETMAAEDLRNISLDEGIAIEKLLNLPPARQRQVLRQWFCQLGFPIPSAVKMQQIQEHFLEADQDKLPHIIWGDVELRRFQNKLYAMKCLSKHDPAKTYTWDLRAPLVLPNLGILEVSRTSGAGLRADITHLDVRFRLGGERCQLPGRKGHHDLKKLFQQWQVPPWERDRIPLLYLDDKLVAVLGFFIDSRFAAKDSEEEGLSISIKSN